MRVTLERRGECGGSCLLYARTVIWDMKGSTAAGRPVWIKLLASIAFGALLALTADPAEAATTFTVNKTGDAGDRKLSDTKCDSSSKKGNQCTLRAAIEEANDTTGEDTIKFDVGGNASVKSISPASQLPTISETVTINGYSQRGASENTMEEGTDAVLKVELDGSGAGTNTNGLVIGAGVTGTTIEGLAINRFDGDGVFILSGASDNSIEGNFIGTNASGTADLGNVDSGVHISGSSNTIGGTDLARRNLLSGNGLDGVEVVGSDNTVGGTEPGAANTISGNADAGVLVNGPSATGNSVLSNEIFANDDLGIELGFGSGVTPNDPDDPDPGANNLQNFPTISSATRSSTTGFTTIAGSLNSTPNQDFLIQCFLTESPADPSEHGEGKVLLDTTSRSTGPAGNTTFQCDSQVPGVGQTVTATATNVSSGDTSEFSENETVVGLVSPP